MVGPAVSDCANRQDGHAASATRADSDEEIRQVRKRIHSPVWFGGLPGRLTSKRQIGRDGYLQDKSRSHPPQSAVHAGNTSSRVKGSRLLDVHSRSKDTNPGRRCIPRFAPSPVPLEIRNYFVRFPFRTHVKCRSRQVRGSMLLGKRLSRCPNGDHQRHFVRRGCRESQSFVEDLGCRTDGMHKNGADPCNFSSLYRSQNRVS